MQQATALSEALPIPLLIEWAAGRANLPGWAKHHLEALDRHRKEGASGGGKAKLQRDLCLLTPLTGREQAA